ncbi:ras small GTPase [Aureobasidium pullulans]|uniref:Ras small GTPase n=1 Tax=Aureobasidium pullulans TaxID=5580 RepID=A0A4V4K7A9_AURPU|nr:ras small GTPase [Aureobasidium pullulans]THW75814.1 ras small GTPase [Aureobasidium pullulans]THX30417.1 ras small GTPase [Aureobasidium pullulans]THX33468.1 ras small GTPase [Aureobasidium pullulans]THY71450.1 ras small GTPase [Aureobasidium pullulans]
MDDKISITICGDGGCGMYPSPVLPRLATNTTALGKSSITLRIVRSAWTHDYDPTIEDSYSVTRTINGQTYSLHLTDTAGQEEYRGMWSAANLTSDAFLLVYDITNAQSLQNLDFFAELIEMEKENRQEQGRCWPAIMVAGNKCDLQGQRQVGAAEGLEWAKSRGCGFMETSAREVVNIEETFASIVKRVVEAREQHASGMRPDFPSLINPTPHNQRASAVPETQQSAPAPNITSDAEKQRYSQSESTATSPQKKKKKSGFFSSLKCW